MEAAASTAPANSGRYPVFFINGMVTAPVVTVLPTEDPDTIPQRAEEITATFAGPPSELPAIELASSIKKSVMPVCFRKLPNMTNNTMKVEHALIGVPITPSVV